jgi:hypothetical protein
MARRDSTNIDRKAFLATRMEGGGVPALCCNLLADRHADERNPEYAVRLQQILRDLAFTSEYVNSVTAGRSGAGLSAARYG